MGISFKFAKGQSGNQPQNVIDSFNPTFQKGERFYFFVLTTDHTGGQNINIKIRRSDGSYISNIEQNIMIDTASSHGWEWWNWYNVWAWFEVREAGSFSVECDAGNLGAISMPFNIPPDPETPQPIPTPTPIPEPTPLPDPTPSPLPDGTERVNCSDPRAIGNLPDGTCFANIIIPVPTPTPTPQLELYEIDIVSPINPNLPNWMVERLRSVMLAGGWELSNISKTSDGYKLQVAKQGSVSAVVIITMISVVLALIAVKIISTTITRLSDNKRDQVVSENIKNSVNTVIEFCNQNGLSPEECEELINAVKNIYEEVIPPPSDDDGLFGGIFDNIELVVGAVLVVSLINAMKR